MAGDGQLMVGDNKPHKVIPKGVEEWGMRPEVGKGDAMEREIQE